MSLQPHSSTPISFPPTRFEQIKDKKFSQIEQFVIPSEFSPTSPLGYLYEVLMEGQLCCEGDM